MQFLEANKYLIRYYYVYKYKNFNKAAENFYVSGTDRNMKYAVTQLEDLYNLQLIKVEGNKLDFTEFGHILGEYTRQIYDLNVEINHVLQSVNFKEIRLGTTYDFYKHYIKPVFDEFMKDHADMKLTLIKSNQNDLTQLLIRRMIDFAIGTIPLIPNPSLDYQVISDGKIMVVYKEKLKDKLEKIESLNQLEDLKIALNDKTAAFSERFYLSLEHSEADLNLYYQTTDYESLIDAVQKDLVDCAIVGNYTLEESLYGTDISHLFKPVQICFIYRKGEGPTKAIQELIRISRKLQIRPIS